MQNEEQPTNDTIPWPVWLVVAIMSSLLGETLARFFYSPWLGHGDSDGVFWSCAFAALLWHSLLEPKTRNRRDALHYLAVVALIPLVSGSLGFMNFEVDERAIRASKHQGEALFMLAFGAVCSVAWIGLRSSVCDRYFKFTTAKIHPHVLTSLILVFSLSSAHWQFRNYNEKKYAQEMKPTITQMFVRDIANQRPLGNIQMLSSKSAPSGLDDWFRKRHQAFSGSTMIDRHQAAFVSIKTAIAEPLKLRFGSDGYDPAEVIIQPGHEGRIELGLKPVAEKSASETKP